jgi:CDP-glucose 4,6-dehydratase
MGEISALASAYKGKRVFVTGHTGFKGSWISLWLTQMGAEVSGYALAPATDPAMFTLCGVEDLVSHNVADIRDHMALTAAIQDAAPEIIFHLAAQPIVRLSYAQPLETLDVNVMGTAAVLEAARTLPSPCAVVIVTSDKCYANREWAWGYRENDPMGGSDPYSMSKGAAELVVDSWRSSFFSHPDSKIRLASARAGNVIGGGDWAEARILTDCVAAFAKNEKVQLRNPLATRPWQHVLEPLSGYLWLGARLLKDDWRRFAQGWNFGPNSESVCTVEQLVDLCTSAWGQGGWQLTDEADPPKEAMSLSLSIEKAQFQLKWRPVWTLQQCVEHTVNWYKDWSAGGKDLRAVSLAQIANYENDAQARSLDWAQPV